MSGNIRKVAKLQDFADVLTSVGGGWRTTFVYLNAASFKKTGSAVDMDRLSSTISDDFDQDVSNRFNNFIAGGNKRNNKFPFSGVVKVAKYTVNWQTARKHRDNYNDFVTKSDELSAKYAARALQRQGLPLTQDALDSVQIKSRKQRDYERQEQTGQERKPRKDDRRFVDYGKGGMYVRTNDFNKKGENRVVIPQNFKNLTSGGKHYYLINDDGSIAGGKPVPEATIQEILSKSGGYDKSKANALRKLGANEEEIKGYLQEFDNLGWAEYDFLADSFLYVVASCTENYHDGMPEKIVFFNEDLVDEFTSKDYNFKINPSDFMEIARNEINTTYGITLESKRYLNNTFRKILTENHMNRKRNRVRLTESDLHKIVKESVKRIIMEDKRRAWELTDNGIDEFDMDSGYPTPETAARYGAYDYRIGSKMEKARAMGQDQSSGRAFLQSVHDVGEKFTNDNPIWGAAREYVNHGKFFPLGYSGGKYFDDNAEEDLNNFNRSERRRMAAADKRWQKAADSRRLHKKGSLNRV